MVFCLFVFWVCWLVGWLLLCLGFCFGSFCLFLLLFGFFCLVWVFLLFFSLDMSYANTWGRKEHCNVADRGKILQAAVYCLGCLWGLHGYANECPKGETSCHSFSITRTADRNIANTVLEQKASVTTTYRASFFHSHSCYSASQAVVKAVLFCWNKIGKDIFCCSYYL